MMHERESWALTHSWLWWLCSPCLTGKLCLVLPFKLGVINCHLISLSYKRAVAAVCRWPITCWLCLSAVCSCTRTQWLWRPNMRNTVGCLLCLHSVTTHQMAQHWAAEIWCVCECLRTCVRVYDMAQTWIDCAWPRCLRSKADGD